MLHFIYGYSAGALMLAFPWPIQPHQLWFWAASLIALLALGLGLVQRGRLRHLRDESPDSMSWSPCPPGRLQAIAQRAPWRTWLAGAIIGLGWSVVCHEALLTARVQAGGSGHAVPLRIRVASDPVPVAGPQADRPGVRFVAEVLESRGRRDLRGRRLRLAWYGAESVVRGEVWQVASVVRPPWGYANPGGMDYERWLTGQGLHGTGTIRRGVRVAAANPGPVQRARVRLAGFVDSLELRHGPVLQAQLVGVIAGITPAQWELFRVTGTLHLMVISGLHITLAAALGFAAGRWLCRLCPLLLLRLDARKCGAVCGAVCAAGYLALAGGGLPAVRACVMAAPILVLLAWGRRCRAGAAIWIGLAVVLTAEPLAVHQQGFWLSFGAVALLVFGFSGHYGRQHAVSTLLRTQYLLSVGMAPLLAVLTGTIPLAGLLANLVAVPAVSGVVVPLTLCGGMLSGIWPSAAALCLQLADGLLVPLFGFLERCAGAPLMRAEPSAVAATWGTLAGLLWPFSTTRSQRILLLLCLGSALVPPPTGVPPGAFRVLALDVGQGDAIVVDTARHRLLFDTGPAFPGGFETGSAVVVPSLQATGAAVIDTLVLSHADLDHTGGAQAVTAALPVRRIYASFAWPGASSCRSANWVWDGVVFRLLDVPRPPSDPAQAGGNDDSCVLLVDDGRRRALLAGDIGRAVETRLLRSLPGVVDLMFAPHHGSRTSSSRGFVRFARPRWVLVSAGRDNRYGHPHPEVVERYRAVGATVRETARSGALRWESFAAERVTGIRDGWIPYWRGSAEAAGGS